ncbi:MAG: DEAD/DEAH box helicase [Spirulinaceae cyanobacterium]
MSYHRLAPFIQEYIYNNGWQELRQVQIEACEVIFDSNAHLLLATGTASGKTEAAFLPILTVLHHNPAKTIGVLYISPIKALIDDQFERLNDLLKQTHTSVCAWHGDIAQSKKKRLLKEPQGILQITPESLESLLINHHGELKRLFGDLRFIVIDEIHAFMGSQRGSQILCQLTRLSRQINQPPRRIGLSATLGDYSLAKQWLQSGTDTPVIAPEVESSKRQVRLALEHFFLAEAEEDSPYYQYIYQHSLGSKALIFTNNRTETETVIAKLRSIAQTKTTPDIYHVHHGSISAFLRERAERAMRTSQPAVTAATVTLEMGIDIGQLERVIQVNAPFSVSSFLQRLGRTGRRGNPADMRFVCTEDELLGEEALPKQIPWQLLQSIAIIQLYLEERWIEPIPPASYPFSLLYHQTLSTLTATGELSPATLAQEVLSLPIFQTISPEDFRQLLHYLISIEHLQTTETGGLIIGLKGEKIVGNFHFYAIFDSKVEYVVKGEAGEIGSIPLPLPQGDRFTLAGKTWQIKEIDQQRKTVFVQETEGFASTSWRGGKGTIHNKVLQKMRQVLGEDVQYAYLQPGAQERLNQARQLAKVYGLATGNLITLEDDSCCLLPWMGTMAYGTLERYINLFIREKIDIRKVKSYSPYYLIIHLAKGKFNDLWQELIAASQLSLSNEDLIAPAEAPRLHKYDAFIPNNLLRKAYAKDCLDVKQMQAIISKLSGI